VGRSTINRRSFAETVDTLQKNYDKTVEFGHPDEIPAGPELLNQLATAIRKQDFSGFNELMKQVPSLTVQIWFHCPDLTEPGFTEADVEGLSKFIKPKVD
jgi:hypothetical protein